MTSKQSLSLTRGVSSYLCLLALSATLAAAAVPTLSAQIEPRRRELRYPGGRWAYGVKGGAYENSRCARDNVRGKGKLDRAV